MKRDPTKAVTVTNKETGEHIEMSFSDAAFCLNVSIPILVETVADKDITEIVVHELVEKVYLIRKLPKDD